MRINVAIPEAHVTAPVLDGALEAVTRLNESLIKAGASPTSDQLIDAGARWQPEKPGAEHFDHGALIAKRGHGDCDDWAPLHAATLRVTGEDPGAMAVVRKSGPKRWHAIVRRSDGSVDDPSLAAGMPGSGKPWGVHGAVLPRMFEGMTEFPLPFEGMRTAEDNANERNGNRVAGVERNTNRIYGQRCYDSIHGHVGSFIATPHLALRPVADRHGQVEAWQARADLPWHWHPSGSPADLAMVTLHQSPVSDQAVVGAVRGAYRLGVESGYAEPAELVRLKAIADACSGCPWEELAELYGPEHATAAGAVVGSFFSKAFKKLKMAANPFELARRGIKVVSPKAARAFGKFTPTNANLLKYGPLAAKFLPGGAAAAAALQMASPLLKKSVKSEDHLPPALRSPAAQAPIIQNFYGGWTQGAPAMSSPPGAAWPPRS